MTKQYNEYSSLSQSDRLGLCINRIDWSSDISSNLYRPVDHTKTVALTDVGRPL